ncbi:MAG: radical SAM protein [Thiotrichaceae bacterium]|nr:radical SAM protein [Thiotrichaceae bacterium]
MQVLLLTPPMTQLNTPYPATAYLTGFLREQGYTVTQRDLAIEVLLRMLSTKGLDQILERVEDFYADTDDDELDDDIYDFFSHFQQYRQCVEPTIRFLQGKDPSLAIRIASRQFLPESNSFNRLDDMAELFGDPLQNAFGTLGTQDKAKYLATLFINDLINVITKAVDPHFEVSRYAERLASSNPSFDDLNQALQHHSFTQDIINQCLQIHLQKIQPDIVGITVPFPGNMLGALQMAQIIKSNNPHCIVTLGGGYINTELRQLNDPRLFDWVDYITLDDGERPLLTLLEYLAGRREQSELVRCFFMQDQQLVYQKGQLTDFPHTDIGTPTYDGLDLSLYLSLCEMLNAMHRIWSDGRWNKLTVAHGCYWSKCSFCDISLDYIKRYDDAGADILVQRIESLIAETGQTGFHFVDEAAPPKVLFALAERLIEKGITITWWGNIRFEKTFTPERCQLLADSGCIAISGGLEVASDRLLKQMKKGVTVTQVAQVTKAFSDAGILVHAYLMYGFPTQTADETVLSLEYVRQLMMNNCFQSAYWHRFSATAHSPIGLEPKQYGVQLLPASQLGYAHNDIEFTDHLDTNHEMLGKGLNKALYNYMHGIGFNEPLKFWFDDAVNMPKLPKSYIYNALFEK